MQQMRSTVKTLTRTGFALLMLTAAACSSANGDKEPVVGHKPERILVVGNSISYQHGVVLKASLAQDGVEVVNEASPEIAQWGEVNPFLNLKDEYGDFVKKYKPDVVLVTTFFAMPEFQCTGTKEEVAACKEEGIKLSDAVLAKELLDTLSQTGAKVVWVHYPHSGPFYLQRSVNVVRFAEILGEAMDALAKQDSRLATVGYEKAITNPGENFTRWIEENGKWLQLRGFDDLHLCQFGAEKFAEYMSPLLDPTWDDHDPTWRSGAWRKDYLFNFQTFKGDPQCSNEALDAPIPSPMELPTTDTTP